MAVSPRTRFEVFKRDSFTCQYCGKKAPEVILHADHIHPRSRGGTDDIMNLITACQACNAGKSDVPLSIHATLEKRQAQLEALQIRREQIEMMLEWQSELGHIERDTTTAACDAWHDLLCGRCVVNEVGRKKLSRWIRTYDIEETLISMRIAVEQYLRNDEDGNPTIESINFAFEKIAGILRNRRAQAKNPWLKDVYDIIAVLRTRLPYYNQGLAHGLLRQAITAGASLALIKLEAQGCRNWSSWREFVEAQIEKPTPLPQAEATPGPYPPPPWMNDEEYEEVPL